MCTYHQSQLKKAQRYRSVSEERWDELVAGFEPFSETGIEPTQVIPILTGERKVVPSSWGFRRAFASKRGPEGTKTKPKPVVNAQSEKMDTFMWKESYHHQRCVIPVTAFFEWTYPGGTMMAHRIHMGGDPFLVAGLWEQSPEFGLCHTMVTTEPNREVAATGHDRCLVVLRDHEIDPWLNCDILANFHRPDGMFQIESGVPNPRARGKPSAAPPPPQQGELF